MRCENFTKRLSTKSMCEKGEGELTGFEFYFISEDTQEKMLMLTSFILAICSQSHLFYFLTEFFSFWLDHLTLHTYCLWHGGGLGGSHHQFSAERKK